MSETVPGHRVRGVGSGPTDLHLVTPFVVPHRSGGLTFMDVDEC